MRAFPRSASTTPARSRIALANGTLASFLGDLAPKHPEYERLKKALVRYRAIEAAGGWSAVPPETTPDGDNTDLLRARLAVEDETAAEGDLTEALKRYQSRNGLNPDGVLGPRTLAALNVPVATRIGQIRANMERWRWMPREFEPRRIVVNVAGRDARLFRQRQCRPELDRHRRKSREAHADHPRRSHGRDGQSGLVHSGFDHVERDCAAAAQESVLPAEPRIRCRPAGRFASLLDHATRSAGSSSRCRTISASICTTRRARRCSHATPRTLSHGCVRVEQIAPLASLAISGDAHTMMDELSDIIATRKTTRIPLDERIPVYMLYWTAIADDDGHAGFPRDVYGRDRRAARCTFWCAGEPARRDGGAWALKFQA